MIRYDNKNELKKELKALCDKLLDMRDGQEVLKCNDEDDCVCNLFDVAADSILAIIEEIEQLKP